MVATDHAFVVSSWARSLHGMAFRWALEADFNRMQLPLIRSLVVGCSLNVVACVPDDPDTIQGFIVADPTAIHYAFVKFDFRRLGIANELIDHIARGQNSRPIATHWWKMLGRTSRTINVVYQPQKLGPEAA